MGTFIGLDTQKYLYKIGRKSLNEYVRVSSTKFGFFNFFGFIGIGGFFLLL